MTTIILTIVGILLAAVSALMVLWYGGNSFDAGSVNADAATVTSHLSQFQSAVQLYELETETRAQPGPIGYLVPLYMSSMPQNPAGAGWYYDARMADSSQPKSTANGLDLVVAGLPPDKYGRALCSAIAKQNRGLDADGQIHITSSAASLPSSPIGCFDARGWGEITGVYVTYARIRHGV